MVFLEKVVIHPVKRRIVEFLFPKGYVSQQLFWLFHYPRLVLSHVSSFQRREKRRSEAVPSFRRPCVITPFLERSQIVTLDRLFANIILQYTQCRCSIFSILIVLKYLYHVKCLCIFILLDFILCSFYKWECFLLRYICINPLSSNLA